MVQVKPLKLLNLQAVDYSPNYSLAWVIYGNSRQAVGNGNCRRTFEWAHPGMSTAQPTLAKHFYSVWWFLY